MTLRDIIAARLVALGMSQSDLARATNIPRQNLSAILTGKRPLLVGHLLLIDHVLGMGFDYGNIEIS